MTYEQLKHAIRAARDVSGDTELLVFGSQAILGTWPDAPEGVRASIEVDVQAKNLPENTILIDGNVGEESQFHATHGFYVHGVSIESATLPDGWAARTVAVRDPHLTRGYTGHCLEAHDLAASKLAAYREKDLEFVALLLLEGLIDRDTLLNRIAVLPADAETKQRLARWVSAVADDIT